MAERGTARARKGHEGPRRPTVGLVTANIHLGVGVTLWSGVLEAAERADVNLLCFPGDSLSPGGAPRNAVYDLVDDHLLDGVVCWTSTLGLPTAQRTGHTARDERAEALVGRLAGLPVVSLNRALGDHETLLLDSYAGMRKAISHLVKDHGRRRPACIRGPLSNPVSVNRFRAYTDALTRHHLAYDRSLVAASVDFADGAGAAAMRVLLDVRGLRPGRDFDAIVACSDALAADALRILTERGVRVPEDVALISANDSVEARLSDPPLTSVAHPFAELGSLAVRTVLARLNGTAPPARRAVPGTLVVRRSCGCRSPLVAQGAPDSADAPRPRSATRTAGGGSGDEYGEGEGGGIGRGAELTAALHADATGRTADGVSFLALLEQRLGERPGSFDDAAWDAALLRLRASALPALPGDGARLRAERLLGQARLLVSDKSHRLLEYERWAMDQQARRLRALGTTLTTAADTEEITAALARHLPGLDVPGCVLLPPSVAPAAVPLPGERRFTAVLETLHTGGEHLGFALFDGGGTAGPTGTADAADPAGSGAHGAAARHGALYRALGDQISAALKDVRLFEEVRHARDAAEQASQFKTRLLDNATDELRSPVEAILRHTRDSDPATADDADRLLHLIDDLLDLSRSGTEGLSLTRRLLDPRPVLAEAFAVVARPGDGRADRLVLPPRLPALAADAGRLRQIVVNLLTMAASAAAAMPMPMAADADADADADAADGITLTAEADPAILRVRVALAASGADRDERLVRPPADGRPDSGLGLAIARRLAVLHGGSVTLHRSPGPPEFRLELPLPTPAGRGGSPGGALLVAGLPGPPAEVAALAERHGLPVRLLHPDDDLASLLAGEPPAAVAWDADRARPQEWAVVNRLHGHPALRHTPFLLYGPVQGKSLGEALRSLRPPGPVEPAIVADGGEQARERLRHVLTEALPGRAVRAAADGTAACTLFAEDPPGLLVVERTLPDMDGFELVERLHETGGQAAGRPGVPVLMLSSTGFSCAEAERAARRPEVVLLGRGILTDAETVDLLRGMLRRTDPAARQVFAPVRHAVVYLEQHYRHRFSRRQVAEAAGVSVDHLGRLFHRELGLTLWEYLTRLRVERARHRLVHSQDSVSSVARAAGFPDRAYFSRVFRRVTGLSPHAFREAAGGTGPPAAGQPPGP